MSNLIIDIGNSRTKLFVVGENAKIVYSAVYETIADVEKIFCLFPEIKTGIYSASGTPDGQMIDYIDNRLENFIHFTPSTPIPVKNLYKTPETLGSDRLAAAIGVNSIFPDTNLTIFDFGTAITIDFVDSNNNFLGGNISPGMTIRFKSLNNYTSRLPLLPVPEHVPEIGTTTKTAIEAGVVQGIIGEIMSYINNYPDNKIIFTGGDAFYFVNKIKYPVFAVSNPVVFGLNKILIYNDKNG